MLETFEVSKVLIIAPLRVARDTWPAEIEKWDHLQGLDISVIVGDTKTRIAALHHPAMIYVINRENIKWLVEYYEKNGMRWDFGMVVIDELSSFKNYQSQRFKFLRKVRPYVKRWVGLTGTPSSNGLMDLWAEIGILDGGERLGKFIGRYREAYFKASSMNPSTGVVFQYKPREGAEELIYQRISDITISMKALDYLHMPDCIPSRYEVEMSASERELYDMLRKDLLIPLKDGDINAFLNDLMSKMKLPEAKGKKKAEQSESVAQILAAMQKVRAEKKKPPVTSYAPVKEMPVNEPESMEEFSQLASDVMQECRPAMPTVKTSISEKAVRVAAYIRVSSTNPAQEDSYEMQERYFMSLLAGNAGWTSAGIYSDHGISATSRDGRTGFNRLLRHCKQGKIDRVICKSISRFARNTQDFLVALRTLKENNVTILFEREAMDTADAYSEFILTTLAAIAQEESRSISANIAWSNQKRFPAGNVCNKDIYGYEFRKGEYTVNENGYRYRAVFIIPEEAEIVRMVFRLFTKEELGFTQIAQKLDALHIPPPNSGCRQRQKRKPTVLPAGTLKEEDKRGWTATDVRYMIANVRYCGSVLCQKTYTDHRNGHKQKVNKGEKPKYLIRNHHPAIISEELWQEAQEVWKVYTAKYRGIEKGRNERNYSKLLLCGECGRYFQGHSTTRTTIWRCATKLAQQGQKRCRMEPIYEEQIQMLLCKAFDGYQVVRKELFAHLRDPAIVIRKDSITFNTACISGLEDVVYVHVMFNSDLKRIVVRGCDENDKDALRWCIAKPDKRKSRKMSCKPFSELVYNEMGWDSDCRYKILGYRINFEGETLYVFDLLVPEIFHEGQKRKKGESAPQSEETKPVNTRKGFYPDDIAGTFGVPVEEHLKESEVKQIDGYVSMGILTGKVPNASAD